MGVCTGNEKRVCIWVAVMPDLSLESSSESVEDLLKCRLSDSVSRFQITSRGSKSEQYAKLSPVV